MEFRLLGPLEVSNGDGSLPLGGPKQRTVLAVLLLQANRVVTVDRLTDAIWGSEPPQTARNTIQTYVRHLRKALGAERIEHRSSGYALVANQDEVDLLRFEALVEDARRLTSTDPPRAIATLREAIALWRGPALDDLADQASLRPDIARLEESHVAAIEDRVAADLTMGRHRELVPELETLVGHHPFRERLWGQLMVALYRSGRQAEALAAYQRVRKILVEELGIDPSPELQRLEEQILKQDGELELPGEPLRGYRLIERIGEGAFGVVYRAHQPQVGREVAIKSIHYELANDPEFVRRFEREARLIARLEHPHIVPLYDYWRDPDGAYLVMRFFRGGSLRARIDRSGPLAPDEAAGILERVAQALAAAHRQGVVHRDVKPENVLLDEDGNAYLSDFRIAKEFSRSAAGGRSGMAGTPTYASPEQIRGDAVSQASDIYALGVVTYEALTGRHPFPNGSIVPHLERHLHDAVPSILGDRPDLPPAIDGVIARATAKDPSLRYVDALDVAAALREALGALVVGPIAVSALEVANPYKGLHPFDEPDAGDFFGRERMTERLVTRLGEEIDGSRLLAVVGPSGSGKSSLVQAGLLPALRRGALPGSETWFYSELVPGAHPFEELELAMLRVAIDPPASLAEQLERDERGLLRAVKRILPADGRAELVLVVDQLEELFTLTPSESDRSAFLAAIAAATTDPESRLRVILMLRADFYDRPLLDARFGQLLAARTEAITPLAPDELERAITGPAERVGVSLEPSLVAETLADVANQPGALPLLQYALTELFDRRRDRTMTLAAYREIGGVSWALAGRAEELFRMQEARGKEACRQLFLRLVALGERTEDTRRRVPRSELDALEVDRGSMDAVIEAFGRHRLLAFDRDEVTREPTVELAHAALIRVWARLHDWIDEGREDMRVQRRLVASAEEWSASGREPSFLLGGARLERLASWITETRLALSRHEREFVEESLERNRAELAAERARTDHERSLERRSVRRMRALVAVLAAAALVASGLTVVAVDRTREAERRRDEATVAGLTQAVLSNLETDPDLSLLLALHAVARGSSLDEPVPAETVEALQWALQATGAQYPVDEAPTAIVAGPAGRRGVFALPVPALVDLALATTNRSLTPIECDEYFGSTACPSLPDAFPARIPAEPIRDVGPATAGQPLSGTSVSIIGQFFEPYTSAFKTELDRVSSDTGIDMQFDALADFETRVQERLAAGDPPDIAVFPEPGFVAQFARDGVLMDLSTYLDVDRLRNDFSPYLVSLGTVANDGSWPSKDGGLYGAMLLVQSNLVWYPVPEFRAAGYDVPKTWQGLIRLSARLRDDGRSPWCMGFRDGPYSGWPGTNWIENLLLVGAGPDVYDDWTSHRIPFDSSAVRHAFERLGDVVFPEDSLYLGVDSVLNSIDPYDTKLSMVETDPPQCWLDYSPSYTAASVASSLGTETAAFAFPSIDPEFRDTLVGGGIMAVAFTDRPEVREVMRRLLSPRFGERWVTLDQGLLSANRRFDLDMYSPFWKPQARRLEVALATDGFRFDGSDLMPIDVQYEFWDSMMTYLAKGPDSLDRILSELDAAWPGG